MMRRMSLPGVTVCDGWDLRIQVTSSHLAITEGGVTRTYPRAGSGLRRVVIIAHSGYVTLSAIQWGAHLGIPIICIGPDGTLLWTSAYADAGGAKSNGRLLRAQALAGESRVGLTIARDLLKAKLEITADYCHDDLAKMLRTAARVDVPNARDVGKMRAIEGAAAAAYFETWDVPVQWCDPDAVPKHWLAFDSRKSLVTGRNRAATNPVNAVLNYLYTIASTECRIACHALGLSPLLGFLHNDGQNSEPMVYDLLEPVRPIVELWVKDLFARNVICKSMFGETVRGVCKIEPGGFLKGLTATGPLWARAVAPHAETVLHTLAKSSVLKVDAGTPLTATKNRLAHGRREYETIDPAEWAASFPEIGSCAKCR